MIDIMDRFVMSFIYDEKDCHEISDTEEEALNAIKES